MILIRITSQTELKSFFTIANMPLRLIALTMLTMIAFAGNSLLCRVALKETTIDAASFTSIRLLSGTIVLLLLANTTQRNKPGKGSWRSALALFLYAGCFSFAYNQLTASTGALLLFGAVQLTMLAYGLVKGERFSPSQLAGFTLALCGLVGLLLPGLTAPPMTSSLLMLCSGLAWGIYSLRGKGAGNPTRVTAGNFLRAVPMALALSLTMIDKSSLDGAGVGYAIASGALASGLGYAIWYAVLPSLQSTHAATVQLSVLVISALGGILFLSEPVSLRFILASIAILGGIALVLRERSVQPATR